MELLIARHGQSVADIEHRYEGRADYPLTDLGREQAGKLASWFIQNLTPEIIISSPLKRASETAELIGNAIGIKVQYNDALMEMDSGLLGGMLRTEADIKYPMRPRMPHEQVLGGESQLDFRFRAEKFWSEFVAEYAMDENSPRVLLVSHGGMINMLFGCMLRLPISGDRSFRTNDTGLHFCKIDKSKVFIHFINRIDHLLT